QIELAGRTFHIQEDHILRLRWKMRTFWAERIQIRSRVGCAPFLGQQARQSDRPEAAPRRPEKVPSAQCCRIPFVHNYSRVMNSSAFSSARAKPNQAAASAGSTFSNSARGIASLNFEFPRAICRRL